MSNSNNTIRLQTGANGTARIVTTTAAASNMSDTSYTVNVDEVRRVLGGGLGKKSASTVPPPPPSANMSTSKEKTGTKRKSGSDKKKKDKEGGQKPKKSKSVEKQVEGAGGRLVATIAEVVAGGSNDVDGSQEEDSFGDEGSVFSLPDVFPESQPEDPVTVLLELTRVMSNVTRGVDAEKKIDDLFSPKTLTQIGVPAVLELLEDSERFEDVDDTSYHMVRVQQWHGGLQMGEDVVVRLPGRIGKKNTPLLEGSIVTFYNIRQFTRNGEQQEYHEINVTTPEQCVEHGGLETRLDILSRMDKQELFSELGCGTLNDIPIKSFFVVITVQPVVTGTGANERTDLLAVITRIREDTNDRIEENIVVPGRLKPQLIPERLPLIGLYKGKRKTKDGAREYHDVQFMKGDDRRVTSLCMLEASTARQQITFD